jgi:hypothetical protein
LTRKTRIIKIKFTAEQQEEIDRINKGETVPTIKTIIEKKTGKRRDIVFNHRFTFEAGVKRFRELYGGMCSSGCGNWPDYKIMVDVGDERCGAWLVSRYCQSCFDKQPIADTYNKRHRSKSKK